MKNISAFSVYRPIFTIMVVLIVIILGGISLSRLPIDLMPDITFPTLSVRTDYGTASPQEIEELVTRPIEEALSAVPGVEEITSVSSEGSSNVRIAFAWGTDLDAAANDIRDRIDRVIPRLPDDASRPMLRKFDLASFPVLILGASSELDPVQTRNIIDEQVKYRIERVAGVAALDVWGGLEREIQVNINPEKIKALEIPLSQVLERIRSGNINLPAGSVHRGNYEVTIRTPGEYRTLDELRETVIVERNGTAIPLSEIAQIEDTWERVRRIVRVNGVPGLRLSVNKQSGTNTVQVAKGVLQEIERINEDIPQIRIIPIINTSEYIESSIRNVGQAALFGGLLAVLVLLIFLRNLRSTAVIATAIPVSIVATFALMYFSGFTINLMTLGGLALGIGMLVDNSIVVLENIYRLRERGESPLKAAVLGSQEVSAAIIASTLTTLVVFLPLIFVRGMAGVMFQQLSYVIAFSLICSLATALTLVPTLSARLLHTETLEPTAHEGLRHKIFRITGRAFQYMEDEYKALLHLVLNHRLLTAGLAALLFGGSIYLAGHVGTELMPAADEGEVRVNVEMEVGTRLDIVDKRMRMIEDLVRRETPEIANLVASTGGSHWGGRASHRGNLRISLLPARERSRSSEQVAVALRRKLSDIPGARVRVRTSSGLFIFRRMAGDGDRVQIVVRGYDLEIADELARQVRIAVESVDGITDARVSREGGSPEEQVLVNRQRASDMRLTVRRVAETLQTALSGSRAGSFREGGKEFTIRVQVEDAENIDLDEILDLTVANAEGRPVVLRNVVELTPRTGPVQVERTDQERVVSVSADVSGRDMGSVIADIRERVRAIPVPRDFSIVFAGDYEEQQKAFRELLLGFILALVLVYMVLACQYESLRDPFIVMFSVPLAAIGVILMLFLSGTTFNIQSYIGCIMLGGIVVNNAILLVDTANLLRRNEGMPTRAAIEEAGRRRLRPILMTALTTILGLIPLAIGIGEGGEAQAPMARAVIGGLISSTLITLVIIPVVYSLFEGQTKATKVKSA